MVASSRQPVWAKTEGRLNARRATLFGDSMARTILLYTFVNAAAAGGVLDLLLGEDFVEGIGVDEAAGPAVEILG